MDLITVHAADGVFLYVSPSMEALLGYGPDELIGQNPAAFIHPEDQQATRFMLRRVAAEDDAVATASFRFRHAEGGWVWLESFARNRLGDPAVGGVVVNSRDITERRQLVAEIAHQAFYDLLTGLPNRNLFMDRLTEALARASQRDKPLGMLFLDLDGFKLVNDSLGHREGDRLLAAVAQRLIGCLRPGDTLARFGGDEFTVLLEQIGDVTGATAVAERLIAALHAPFDIGGHEVFVSASIGIALGRGSAAGLQPDELLRQTDVALYRAKGDGKGRCAVFDAEMNAGAVDRLDLQSDLQHAIDRGELVLHYQPEIDLLTERVVGMEALVRWQHPRLGLLAPGAFIPLAEETGLVLPLGSWVLRAACRQARLFLDAHPAKAPLVMGVNLSARQFAQPDLVDEVARVLRETRLPAACLRLEITESTAMHGAEAAGRTLRELKALGVQIAIDDFGTGYSSLAYLQHFAVDTLKVDRSFVSRLAEDAGASAIVRAVTMLAHALGIDVTAEGIETAEQLACLRALDCDHAQGFYFARPLTVDALAALLHAEAQPLPLPLAS